MVVNLGSILLAHIKRLQTQRKKILKLIHNKPRYFNMKQNSYKSRIMHAEKINKLDMFMKEFFYKNIFRYSETSVNILH